MLKRMVQGMYKIFEQIGNFSDLVYQSANLYEVQDYLEDRFTSSELNTGNEDDAELFYSYFHIECT